MTRDELIRMASDCGLMMRDEPMHGVERFAALVAAAEREACAKVCMEIEQSSPLSNRVGWEHGIEIVCHDADAPQAWKDQCAASVVHGRAAPA